MPQPSFEDKSASTHHYSWVRCPRCGTRADLGVERCPQCSADLKGVRDAHYQPPRSTIAKLVSWLLLAAILAMLATGLIAIVSRG